MLTVEQLRGVLDLVPDATLAASEVGRIVLANEPALALFGCDVRTLAQRPFATVVPRSGHGVVRRANDEPVPVEVVFQQVTCEEGPLVVAFVRDLTTQHALLGELSATKEALENEWDDRRQLRALSMFMQSLQSRDQIRSVLTMHLESLLPATSGAVLLLDRTSSALEPWAEWGTVDAVPVEGLSAERCLALRSGQPHGRFGGHATAVCAEGCHGRSDADFLCTPLVADNEPLGVLHLQATGREGEGTAPRLSPSDQRRAQAVAERIAPPIANLCLREALHQQTLRDGLTGAFNRRFLEETLRREVTRAARWKESLAVVMVDVDYFKRINDTYGHALGDDVLRTLVRFFSESLRTSDLVCRYGGEEFALIMPASTARDAVARIDLLRQTWAKQGVDDGKGGQVAVTFSAGVAAFPDDGTRPETLLGAADIALYGAKCEGRNRVFSSEYTPVVTPR